MLLLLRVFGRPDVTLRGLTARAVQVPTNSNTCTVVLHSSYLLLTPVPVSSRFPQLLSSFFFSSFSLGFSCSCLQVSPVPVSWFLQFLSLDFSSSDLSVSPVPVQISLLQVPRAPGCQSLQFTSLGVSSFYLLFSAFPGISGFIRSPFLFLPPPLSPSPVQEGLYINSTAVLMCFYFRFK